LLSIATTPTETPRGFAELAAAAVAEHPDVFVTEGGVATASVAKLLLDRDAGTCAAPRRASL
jgi:hypothetical protein